MLTNIMRPLFKKVKKIIIIYIKKHNFQHFPQNILSFELISSKHANCIAYISCFANNFQYQENKKKIKLII